MKPINERLAQINASASINSPKIPVNKPPMKKPVNTLSKLVRIINNPENITAGIAKIALAVENPCISVNTSINTMKPSAIETTSGPEPPPLIIIPLLSSNKLAFKCFGV